MQFTISNVTALLATIGAANAFSYTNQKAFKKSPPIPEPINIIELPLPFVVSNNIEGSCTLEINLHSTKYMCDNVSGSAQVVYGNTSSRNSIAVTYFSYTNNGVNVLNGFENVSSSLINSTLSHLDRCSNLTSIGETYITRLTSAGRFHLEIDLMANNFQVNGTLMTTVDGVAYYQPLNDA
jgi:hypothetical protein